MKNDFWLLTIVLILSRILDFYSTKLWFFQPGGMEGEMNPLTRFFGVGWNGLVAVNILVIIFIIWNYYFYCFQYHPMKFENPSNDFKLYISRLYFGVDDAFNKVFFSFPPNKNASRAHFGYTLIRVVIFGSILASIHNFCQFYNVEPYNVFRSIVKRPLYVIYGAVLLSFIYFQYRAMIIEFMDRLNPNY